MSERKIRSEKEKEDEGWPFRSFQTIEKSFNLNNHLLCFFLLGA
jgi:hypothetical protein